MFKGQAEWSQILCNNIAWMISTPVLNKTLCSSTILWLQSYSWHYLNILSFLTTITLAHQKKPIKLCLRFGRASLIHSSKLFNIPYRKTKLEDVRIIYPSFSQQSLFCISCSASVNLPTAATNCGVRNDFKNKMLFSFSCVSCPSQWKSHGIGFQVQFSAMVTELSG